MQVGGLGSAGTNIPGEIIAERERQLLMARRYDLHIQHSFRQIGDDWLMTCRQSSGEGGPQYLSLFQHQAGAEPVSVVPELRRVCREERPDIAILRYVSDNPEPSRRFSLARGSLILRTGCTEVCDFLPLAVDFDEFLNGLGKKTRRNIRSSLREAEGLGWRLEFHDHVRLPITQDILSLAARCLPLPIGAEKLLDLTCFADQRGDPFYTRLVAPDGTVWSIIIGYRVAGYCAVLCQLNPSDFPKLGHGGASLLHRAMLIAHLIGQNYPSLIFIDGCSGTLRQSCRAQTAQSFLCIGVSPIAWWRIARHGLAHFTLWRRMAHKIGMVVDLGS
jgi:hypothetical protein